MKNNNTFEELVKSFEFWDEEMEALARSNSKFNVDLVDSIRVKDGEEPTILCEVTVDMSYLIPGMLGTVDLAVISSQTLVVSDLKTGFVKKYAGKRNADGSLEINPQLACYASAVFHQYEAIYPNIKDVRLIIHQEAQKNISELDLTLDELLAWEASILKPTIAATLAKKPECHINANCKYCPGLCFCPKAHENLAAINEIRKKASTLSDEEIDALLPKLDDVVDFANSVKDYAIKRMKSGIK